MRGKEMNGLSSLWKYIGYGKKTNLWDCLDRCIIYCFNYLSYIWNIQNKKCIFIHPIFIRIYFKCTQIGPLLTLIIFKQRDQICVGS